MNIFNVQAKLTFINSSITFRVARGNGGKFLFCYSPAQALCCEWNTCMD
jgi:hypothetical protein